MKTPIKKDWKKRNHNNSQKTLKTEDKGGRDGNPIRCPDKREIKDNMVEK